MPKFQVDRTLEMISTPMPLQRRAFELLDLARCPAPPLRPSIRCNAAPSNCSTSPPAL
jgi:hypothetical protein